jgi:serine/threonine-protein kinase
VLGGGRPSAPLVMSDAERTALLAAPGADATRALPSDGPGRHHRGAPPPPPPAAAPLAAAADPVDPVRRNWLKVGAWTAAAVVVAVICWLFAWNFLDTPDRVAVPNVANATAANARSTLQAAGFAVTEETEQSDTVAEGLVVRTNPAAGTRADKGDTVRLVVSAGPAPVRMPILTGLTLEQAQQALANAGLRLAANPERRPSTAEEKDKVVEQWPAASEPVARDSEVRVALGEGPEQVAVPDVSGQTLEAARVNLETAGFKVEVVEVDSAVEAGRVAGTDPAAGSRADKESVVRVQLSNGNGITMPDLTGRTLSQAVTALRAAGWQGTQADIITVPVGTTDVTKVGKIVAQRQEPGSQVPRNAIISVDIGQLAAR